MIDYATLGNMGFSKTKCHTVTMATNQMFMSCSTGHLSKVVDFGVSASFENINYCQHNTTGVCATSLSASLNTVFQNCIGNKSCLIPNLKQYVVSNQK